MVLFVSLWLSFQVGPQPDYSMPRHVLSFIESIMQNSSIVQGHDVYQVQFVNKTRRDFLVEKECAVQTASDVR